MGSGGGDDADGGDGGGDSPDEELSDEQRHKLEELRAALLKQMHRVIDTFRRMDVNGDGRISMEEFRAVLEHLKADGDPEFEHTDISSVSLRSLKRGGAASAAAGGAHPAASNVHGWVSRRTVENLRGSSMLETYCDVYDHSVRESLPRRRHQITFIMGVYQIVEKVAR